MSFDFQSLLWQLKLSSQYWLSTGYYYLFHGTPIYNAICREAKECLFVGPDEGASNKGILWYQNKL
jgi:hypothetical protein